MAIFQETANRIAKIDFVASSQETVGFGPSQVKSVQIIHELGSDLAGGTISKNCLVEPSDSQTLVSIESRVITDATRRVNSPEYLVAIRRRRSEKLRKMIGSLARRARQDDFEAYTFKVVEEIRELLIQLSDVPTEGNTREILRQIRDTFLDGGSDRYREVPARNLVAAIFERLGRAEVVTPDQVDQVWDDLYDSGLTAPIPLLFVVEVGNEERDGQGS